MSSWKRGFLEIIGEILECLLDSPMRKTHITFKCNLDSRAVTKYLSIMMHIGLVEKSKKDDSYFTVTQKGITYRNQFTLFASMLEKDLKNFDLKKYVPAEMISSLTMKRT